MHFFLCSYTPGAHVSAQYYNFIHLRFEGYSSIQKKSLANARFISKALEYTACTTRPRIKANLDYMCLSEIHKVVPWQGRLGRRQPGTILPWSPGR
jgi:glutamate decarboxylase